MKLPYDISFNVILALKYMSFRFRKKKRKRKKENHSEVHLLIMENSALVVRQKRQYVFPCGEK